MIMQKQNRFDLIIMGLLLAIGVAIAGYFVSQTLYNSKVGLNTAEAKGLAERRVIADRANWKIFISLSGKKTEDIPRLYAKSEANQNRVVDLLKENGFEESEIHKGIIEHTYDVFRDEQQIIVDSNNTFKASIEVETDKIYEVERVRSLVNKLITEGIYVDNQAPQYHFTKLNEIKPDMLKEAAQNARIAAKEFAENAGVKVGKIRNATQGGFNITDAGENYGDTQKIEKDVRVVTTITFYLED